MLFFTYWISWTKVTCSISISCLSDMLMKTNSGELARAVTYFYDKIVRDLKSSDGTTRIGSVRIFTELARTSGLISQSPFCDL